MTILIIFLSVFQTIFAYNFNDVLYNQILAEDYEFFSEDLPRAIERARRDVQNMNCHKSIKRPYLCCGGKEFQEKRKEFISTEKECFQQVMSSRKNDTFDPFSCEDLQKRKNDIVCVKQCVAQQKGWADVQGNLNETAVKKFVKEQNNLEWLKPKLDELITKCLRESTEMIKTTESPIKNSSCKSAVLNFSHCMFRETQAACPSDLIENPKKCTKFLDALKSNSSYFRSNHPVF